MIAPMVWTAAERDGFVADVQAMRRRVVDHIPAHEAGAPAQARLRRPARRRVRRPAAPARPRPGRPEPAVGGHAQRAGPADAPAATSAARTARRCTRPTPSCAPSSTASSCTSCGAPTSCPTTRPRCAGSAARWGSTPSRSSSSTSSGATTAARCAGCTRRSSTARCSPPWPSSPARTPGCRWTPPRSGWPRSATSTRGPRCGTSRCSPAASRAPPTSSARCCRSCSSWFADAPDPDAGLFGFRRISESLGTTPWYLKMLRDEGEVAQRLAVVLGTSRYATDLLEREPQGVRMLGESLAPLSAEALTTEMLALAGRHDAARGGGAGGARRTPAGAVPDRVRRALRGDRRRRGRQGPVAADRRDAGGHPRRGDGGGPRRSGRWTRCRPGWPSSRWAATAASSCPTAATPT